MRQPILVLSICVAVLALAGCSSGSAASPAASTAISVAPSAASEAPASTEPSQAAASTEPSAALPSFTLPSDDKGLEALIPDQLCGSKITKASVKGNQAVGADNPEMAGVLAALGKTTADVSAAIALDMTGKSPCGVFIYRIAGADEGRLRDLFKAEALKQGKSYTEVSLGGKTVARTDEAKFQYVWVKGDGVFVVSADSEANAATIISALP